MGNIKTFFFVKHKVMAGAITIITLLVGIISLLSLPVEQYPDIAPPTIYVETYYDGADANSCLNAVVMPLEEAINGVENMDYIFSQATSTGLVTINVVFKQGTDADMATVNVQNRVSKAMGLLPQEVTKVGVQVYKSQNSILQVASLYSSDDRFDEQFVANYLDINVLPRIRRVQGVGRVQFFGSPYSLRVWMNPDQMALYGLAPEDIFAAIGQQNFVSPVGSLGENSANTYQFSMEYTGRLKTEEEFDNIVLTARNTGQVLRLKDVAKVSLGAQSYTYTNKDNGHPSSLFIINQAAGANATAVNAEINKIYKELESELPPGLKFDVLQTSDSFLFAAIGNVVETLVIAILLVVLVVFFFLQDFKATLIPSISVIVSLIGTFAIVKLAGFTLNILTLFALVLAIGTVVDDAIVVVEAVMAKFEHGYKNPRAATNAAMHDVSMAVISCTLVFMGVFIPVTFMPGTSGTFFTQFGITIAASVGLSCISAMTICPALCAMILRPADESKKGFTYRVRKAYDASFNAISGKYSASVKKFIGRPALAWIFLAVCTVLLVVAMKSTPKAMIPQEDQGAIMVDCVLPPGYTLDQTNAVIDQVEECIVRNEEVESVARVAGASLVCGYGSSYGMFIVRLKPWDERHGIAHSLDMVRYKIYNDCQKIKDVTILPFQQPQIPGYGQGNSIELKVQNRGGDDQDKFCKAADQFVQALQQRPEISSVMNTYANNFPKYRAEVDPVICSRAGVSPLTVLSTLASYCSGSYISNFNKYGKTYRVICQSSPDYRLSPASLSDMYVRVEGGKMAPLSQFVTLEPIMGSTMESRFNLYATMTMNVEAAQGYSTGQAHQAIKEVFDEVMPAGYGYEYSGMAREEEASSGSNATMLIYLICILVIYLIMACLYNSWFVPFAVLLSVPFGLLGAFGVTAPLAPLGFTNNIYLQTGVIMLIGLLSKTAILITDNAGAKRKAGMSIPDAAFAACQDRLRPILMTVACMVIGMLPLLIKGGAGSVGNRSLSLGVIGGMIVGTLAMLFVVPVFYIAFQKLHERVVGPEIDYDNEDNDPPVAEAAQLTE